MSVQQSAIETSAAQPDARTPVTLASVAVSVVICTRDRPGLLADAIASVLEQTLPAAELIVVDDGSDPPADTPTRAPIPIRLVRLDGAGPGAARAAGLRAVRSGLVAWCDDDDIWFPDHLAALAAYIESAPDVALVYGDAEWWHGAERGEVPYSIDYDARLLRECVENYILPSTALCRTEAAREAGGFDPALQSYEDWDLWVRMSLSHPMRRIARALGAVRWSEDGVAAAGTDWNTWERLYRGHRRQITQAGLAAEHNLIRTTGPTPRFDRSTWCESSRELTWQSPLATNVSFGVVARHLLVALERQSVQVRIAPTWNQPVRGLERFFRPDDGRGRFGFYYDTPYQPRELAAPRIASYTMWESTHVPAAQVAAINEDVELLWVPSRCAQEIYVDCGVKVPVKLLPHGVDGDAFPVLEREQRDTLTFGTFGELAPRKGIDVLLSAFLAEFSAGEPVRLILKALRDGHGFACDDPRVSLLSGTLDQPGLLAFLGQLDVFALPSRGEGWGLTGLEAMATGIPLIATNWGGPVEYMDAADSLPLGYELIDCAGIVSNYSRYDGKWAEPDRDHLRALMRWCFEHRSEARDMGLRAAARVRREFTWDRPAEIIRRDLDELAAG